MIKLLLKMLFRIVFIIIITTAGRAKKAFFRQNVALRALQITSTLLGLSQETPIFLDLL
jgi:hypothetical protein